MDPSFGLALHIFRLRVSESNPLGESWEIANPEQLISRYTLARHCSTPTCKARVNMVAPPGTTAVQQIRGEYHFTEAGSPTQADKEPQPRFAQHHAPRLCSAYQSTREVQSRVEWSNYSQDSNRPTSGAYPGIEKSSLA